MLAAQDEGADGPVCDDLNEALLKALQRHQGGALEEARALYQSVLRCDPDQPDALHYLGVLLHQMGQDKAGIDSIRVALNVCPTYPEANNNLGNIFRRRGQLGEAEASYRKAIELGPESVTAWHNLAIVLAEQGKVQPAIDAYRVTVDLQPEHGEALFQLGRLLSKQGRLEEAVSTYRRLLVIQPHNGRARHLLTAWTSDTVPERASDGCIRDTFDRFAESFDVQLERLDYRAPELVVEAIGRSGVPASSCLDVLDAGCGTGLCGPLLRPYARCLVGMDISPAMIEKASERAVYDELVTAEIAAWLGQSTDRYDLIVSADTLCYSGDLTRIIEAFAATIRLGGTLVFTLEKTEASIDDDGYTLHSHGRYSHTEAYTRSVLERNGFQIRLLETSVLRTESKKAVVGVVVLASIPHVQC